MIIKPLQKIAFAAVAFFAGTQYTTAQTTNGLEAYYQFSGNLGDGSGNGYHGILEGATLTTDRFGNSNSAYYFDNGDNIRVKNFSSSGFDGVTMSAWVQTSKTSPQQQVVQGAVGVMYINWIETGHFMAAFDGTAGNNVSTDISETYVADSTWHLITATNNGSETRVYVDGKHEATYEEMLSTGTGDLQIGGGGWYFTGKIDEIRIYSRALTDTEIKGLYSPVTTIAENKPVQLNASLKIFPNPLLKDRNFQVELPDKINNAKITITTLAGQSVFTQALENSQANSIITLDLKHFSAGVYMVNLVSENGLSSAKLIVE